MITNLRFHPMQESLLDGVGTLTYILVADAEVNGIWKYIAKEFSEPVSFNQDMAFRREAIREFERLDRETRARIKTWELVFT